MPAYVTVTWVFGDVYHHLTLHIPLNSLDLLKRHVSTGPDGVLFRFPEQKVSWQVHPFLLHQDDHWVSFHCFFRIFGAILDFSIDYISSST